MVRLLAPQSSQIFFSVLWSAGLVDKVFATLTARASEGCGNCRGTHSTDFNWSRRMSTIRLSIGTRLFNFGNSQACRISSFKRADTFITKHLDGKARRSLGNRYSVLIETCPDMVTECGVSAGIHTARIGGTTQTPCRVRSVITPFEANNSWSSG